MSCESQNTAAGIKSVTFYCVWILGIQVVNLGSICLYVESSCWPHFLSVLPFYLLPFLFEVESVSTAVPGLELVIICLCLLSASIAGLNHLAGWIILILNCWDIFCGLCKGCLCIIQILISVPGRPGL